MNAGAVTRFLLAYRRPLFAGLVALAATALAFTTYTFLGTEFEAATEVPVGANESGGFARFDFDNDGIPDIEESVRAGTDVLDPDTDGDELPDGWEARYTRKDPLTGRLLINPLLPDARNDPDGDGLTNLQEFNAKTNPETPDTDADGMPDAYETRFGLNPLVAGDELGDEDQDGLANLEESRLGTDPRARDTDGDGIVDPEEVAGRAFIGTRLFTFTPTDPTRADTGGSGAPDGWAIFFGLDPRDANMGYADPDGDGLGNAEEYRASLQALLAKGLDTNLSRLVLASLSPLDPDTDADELPDGWEVKHVLDPLRKEDAAEDPDADGLANLAEFENGANPRARDTDGDGIEDRAEVVGYDLKLGGKTTAVTSNPAARDTDADGLDDREERDGEALLDGTLLRFSPTNPRNPDSDFDSLTDHYEVVTAFLGKRLDPTVADTDADGFPDGVEVAFWLARGSEASANGGNSSYLDPLRSERAAAGRPPLDSAGLAALLLPEGDVDGDGVANLLDADSDGDGDYLDGAEWNPPERDNRAVPRTFPWLLDTDADGLPDEWELAFMSYDPVIPGWNLNPALSDSDADGIADPAEDVDDDGVPAKNYRYTNLEEFTRKTSPTDADSDGDELPDGWEVFYGERHRAPLSPLVPGDNLSEITRFQFTRFVNVGNADTAPAINASLLAQGVRDVTYDIRAAGSAATGDLYPDVALAGGGNATLVRVHGLYRFTYLAAYRAKADPSIDPVSSRVRSDGDGDGMPDAWEAYAGLDPSRNDGEDDSDGDLLQNVKEYLGSGANARPAAWDERVSAWGHGTDPRRADSDFDSLTDGYEVENSLDPRNPYDAIGDLDGDGVSNRDEGALGTSARDVDSDNDGLLDGATISIAPDEPRLCLGMSCAALFAQEGIVAETRGGVRIHYGETLVIRGVEVKLKPTNPDSDGDNKPDGWEVRYTKRTLDGQLFDPEVATDENHDEDDLQDLTEYLTGRPEGWVEGRDGVWWGGGDPNAADSDADCNTNDRGGAARPRCYDGGFESPLADRDYDNDGLNDFLGEDPFPFTNPLNRPGLSPTTSSALLKWIDEERPESWRLGPDDSPGVPYSRARAEARVDVSAIEGLSVTPEAAILLKGVPFTLIGNVTAASPNGGRVGVPNVTLLVTPYPLGAAASDVVARRERADATLCAGFSGPTGAFRLTCAWAGSQSVEVPNGTVLMGRTAGTVAWTFDTKSLPLGPVGLEVWTYNTNGAARPGEGAYGDYAARTRDITGGDRTFTAHAISTAFQRLETASGVPLALASESRFELTPDLPVVADAPLEGSGRLLDGAGDPIDRAAVRLEWASTPPQALTLETDRDGRFTFTFAVENYTSPRQVSLKAAFDGIDAVRATAKEDRVQVQLPTRLVPEAPPALLAGQTVRFLGTLLDVHGHAVPLAPIEVAFKEFQATATTDSKGRYTVTLPVPATARAGPAEGTLRHLGTPEYLAVTVPVASVVKKPSVIHLDQATPVAILGQPLLVKGRVTDPTGAPVRSLGSERLVLAVSAGGYSGSTVVEGTGPHAGEFTLAIPADFFPTVARHPMVATFSESKLFGPATATGEVLIRSSVTFTLDDSRVTRNATVLLKGFAKDSRGNGIPNLPLNFTLGADRLRPTTTARNGAFQVEVFLPRTHPLGPVTLKGTSPETEFYLRGERAATLVVLSKTNLSIPEKASFKGPVNLEAQLVDDGGFPVPDAPVTLTVDGIPVATLLTDRSGVATDVYVIPDRQPAGVLRVGASYSGGPLLDAARASGNLFVRANTNLTITDVTNLIRGETATLQGALHEDSGHPVSRGEVIVRLAGRELGRAAVDSGIWTLVTSIPVAIPPGPTTLEVLFERTVVLQASSATADVTVKDKARLKLLDVPQVATADATAKVQLLDGRGRGVGNVTLSVALGGRVFQVVTDAAGNASFPVVAYGNDTDRLPVQVRFNGDEGLTAASTKATVALRLTAPPAPIVSRMGAVIGLAVALLLLAGLGAFFLLRRRAAEEAREILSEAERAIVAGDEVRAVLYLAYRKLRATLARQGVPEAKSDTMREFLAGMERILPVDPASLARLTALLEVARYTERKFDDNARRDALDVLRRIDRDLTRALGKKPAAAPGGAEA